MFSKEYLAKAREESIGKVDPAKLHWNVIGKENERPTVWDPEESYYIMPSVDKEKSQSEDKWPTKPKIDKKGNLFL